ncbi:MAG TPA: NAD(P)/FAD-dependent oxidoreductase [Pirellulales bacterium]|nr:NAD(P)/FAD-dependent oxidoreductase [Pirellulales bacterium]
MYDTIIIGAGLSGLAAGIRLAYYEQRVCILERHTTIGGLNSFYRLRGRNYDVGLHAVTNFAPPGSKKGPLAKLLRQLRLRWDDFALVPQVGSSIAFPDVTLGFRNDFEYLKSEVRRAFPAEIDNFQRLVDRLIDYDDVGGPGSARSARAVVGETIRDPLLAEMLFCPLMFYGAPGEHDMEFGHFSVLFRSILIEGLARPFAGIRLILKHLVRKFRELGGELRLRAGVSRLATAAGAVRTVQLDDGEELAAHDVLSSAGWVETMRMCDGPAVAKTRPAGQLSFLEALSTLNVPPSELGCKQTVVFFNDSEKFHWQKPDDLVDVRSGVICSPNNFLYDEPADDGMIRITALANFDRWRSMGEEDYRQAKQSWYDRLTESAIRFLPDFRGSVIDSDTFTPCTIRRFTGHENGAVYGAPQKQWTGTTHLKNLFICGSDQGMLGIIGAMTSGIMVVNRHLLRKKD